MNDKKWMLQSIGKAKKLLMAEQRYYDAKGLRAAELFIKASDDKRAFMQGFGIAVAAIARDGQPGYAWNAIEGAGFRVEDFSGIGLEQFDLKQIRACESPSSKALRLAYRARSKDKKAVKADKKLAGEMFAVSQTTWPE
ncbi:hypothetical protein [Methylobacter sp.]|uniref:hypothetical protein n=1 Tax=Methylobacter sp. TaxID=2051955 RepID=UPI00120139C5|nr:hypothetical protein [Methylobacter sp.]TAK59510.1 MAG: hypothetical protein EPO18_20325 [Methylobacter sp.]